MSSYTSNLLGTVNLSSAEILSAYFNYEFFTTDEALVEGSVPTSSLPAPRWISIEIAPPVLDEPEIQQLFGYATNLDFLDQKRQQEVIDNINSIYSAEDFGNTSATTLFVQDTAILDRLFKTIRRSARYRELRGNPTDIALELAVSASSSPEVYLDPNLLQKFSSNSIFQGQSYVSEETLIEESKFLTDYSSPASFTVNDKFLAEVVQSAESRSLVGPAASISLNYTRAKELQDAKRAATQTYNQTDSESTFEAIASFPADSFNSIVVACANIVSRKEILPDGTYNVLSPLAVLPVGSTSYIDYQVKYGSSYSYWINTVYKLSATSLNENNETETSEVLFQSQAGNSTSVLAVETLPPPPPADFELKWDFEESKLVLFWSLPNNTKRDIKYFQVFRRPNVNQPFKLLREYDFNDSQVLPNRNENIQPLNTTKVSSPHSFYVDSDFKAGSSEFIYCVACVDAHGLVSNYSIQLKAKFDKIKNKLLVEQVSPSGAPRQYPNMYLKGDFFLDSISKNGLRNIRVYFDPDYLKVVKNISEDSEIGSEDTQDLALLSTKEYNMGSYKISVIDLDRSQNSVLELQISDKTFLAP